MMLWENTPIKYYWRLNTYKSCDLTEYGYAILPFRRLCKCNMVVYSFLPHLYFRDHCSNTAKYRYHCQRRALVLNFRHTKWPSRQPQAHIFLSAMAWRGFCNASGQKSTKRMAMGIGGDEEVLSVLFRCTKTVRKLIDLVAIYIYIFVYAEYYPVLSRLFRLWSWTWISDRSHYKVYQCWIWFLTYFFYFLPMRSSIYYSIISLNINYLRDKKILFSTYSTPYIAIAIDLKTPFYLNSNDIIQSTEPGSTTNIWAAWLPGYLLNVN